MKNMYCYLILLTLLCSCTKPSSSINDPCNISGTWRLIIDDTPPIVTYGGDMIISANGDMNLFGGKEHQWKINNACNSMDIWRKSDKSIVANMKIYKLTADALEMEMVSGTISATDLARLILAIDRLQFKRIK